MAEGEDPIWIGSPLARAQYAFGIIAAICLWFFLLSCFTFAVTQRTRDNLLLFLALLAKSMHQLLLAIITGIISQDARANEPEPNPLLGGDEESYRRTVVAMFLFGFLADIGLLGVILRTLYSRYEALDAKFPTTRPPTRLLFTKSAGWALWGFTSISGFVAQVFAADDAWFNVTYATDARFSKGSPDLIVRIIWTIFRTLLFVDILLLSVDLRMRGRKAGFRDRVVSNFYRVAAPCIVIQAIWGIVYRIVTVVATLPNEDSASALNLMVVLANDFPMAIISIVLVIIAGTPQWTTLISVYYQPKPTYPSA